MLENIKQPLVSVIMPVHNSEKYLVESASSVLEQSLTDFELILVDNNSTDSSGTIITKLAEKDSRVVTLSCTEPGAAHARNTGIRHAAGRFIAFLDSDDLWASTKLEKQILFMRSNGYALTHTHYQKIRASGEEFGPIVKRPPKLSYRDMLKSNQIGCLSAIYDVQAIGKKYMPPIKARQDYGLWLSILKSQQFAYCLPESLAMYRVHSSGSVSSNKFSNVKYNWLLFRRVEGFSIMQATYFVAWNIWRKIVI